MCGTLSLRASGWSTLSTCSGNSVIRDAAGAESVSFKVMDDILRILEQDARTSPERIAEMTGRSVDYVGEIIIEAEKNGVILSYKSQINWGAVGRGDVHALIEARVAPHRLPVSM